MAIIFVSLANAATAAGPAGTDWALVAAWVQALAAVAAVGLGVGAIGLLFSIRDRFPERVVKQDKFVEALLKGVRKQTERLQREFNELLRTQPTSPGDALTFVRDLRRLLREASAFIAHMRSSPLPEWPGPELASAFSEWAGVIDSMDALLDDLFDDVTAAIERHSWLELVDQYRREGWYLREDVKKLTGLKAQIEKEAKPFQKKKPGSASAPAPPPPPVPD